MRAFPRCPWSRPATACARAICWRSRKQANSARASRSEERRVGSDWSSDVCSSDLPLKQHAGVPAVPVVKTGDRVRAGDLLAEPEAGKLGARIHASIGGVARLTHDAVVIDAN